MEWTQIILALISLAGVAISGYIALKMAQLKVGQDKAAIKVDAAAADVKAVASDLVNTNKDASARLAAVAFETKLAAYKLAQAVSASEDNLIERAARADRTASASIVVNPPPNKESLHN